MLDVLRSIVQEVNAATDLPSALKTVVSRVQHTLNTNACAIYLLDKEQGVFVLRAAKGLNSESIGQVKLAPSQGLVGLVGARAEPLNLENADQHPNFQYFPETGEEKYHSFLGVPIMHHRNVLGVLLAQSHSKDKFTDETEAFMVTLASQLAVVLAHAEATGSITELNRGEPRSLARFSGVAGSPGIAIGHAVVVYPLADLDAVPDRQSENIEQEIEAFQQAVDKVRHDLERINKKLTGKLGEEERALFDVYLRMLSDKALTGEVIEQISKGAWAQGALRTVISSHVKAFELMEDEYLRERASDIRDLGRRILSHLQETKKLERKYPANVILIGDELTASNLGEVPEGQILGLVSVKGSKNSHISIIARAMEIPIVLGLVDLPYRKMDGLEVIVDGYQGRVFPNPDPELKLRYQTIIREEQEMVKGLESLIDLPAESKDGQHMPLRVNTGLMSDVARSLQRRAEGVGLYRTEVPFMILDRFPSETQQVEVYKEHLAAFAPYPVTMRTLDVGGDKALPYFPIEEANPFLGWRGIRITLDHPEIFLVQIRAMLKASVGYNNLRIMLPMISNVTEVEEALHYIHQALQEVRDEGFDVVMPKVGVMVEVPAAVYQARELAQRVDFLSVGSNDLTQYLLAVDRNNSHVADIYHSYHPAVLKALRSIVNKAHLEHKTVSICGELAGEPGGAILLMAMGYDELSMSASNILRVKQAIRTVTMAEARELLDAVLAFDTAALVQECITSALADFGLETIDTRLH